MIDLFIPGLPVPQPRAKATRRGSHAAIYTPTNADAWKAQIAHEVSAVVEAPMVGALRVHLRFRFPRPKSHFGARGLKSTAPTYHTTRPDVDNLAKAILDALRGIAWTDDGQVAILSVAKTYHETPGVEIEVRKAVES
jgi:Holliday junction resolvase RusA-like endonuclease